jgi:hypothetical protein
MSRGDSRGVIGLLVDANVQICVSCIWSVGSSTNAKAALCHGGLQLVERCHEDRLSTETCRLRQEFIKNIVSLHMAFSRWSSCMEANQRPRRSVRPVLRVLQGPFQRWAAHVGT